MSKKEEVKSKTSFDDDIWEDEEGILC